MAEKHIADWDNLKEIKSDDKIKHYVRYGKEDNLRVVVHKFFSEGMTFDKVKTFYEHLPENISKAEKRVTMELLD